MAQAILLKDVETLGERGDGHRRRRRATCATTWCRASWPSRPPRRRSPRPQRRMEAAEQAAAEAAERAEETAALLRKTVLTIAHQAGDDGRLFGSVTAKEIVDAVKQARGLKLDRRKVQLEEPIKTTGTHMVTVEVADGVTRRRQDHRHRRVARTRLSASSGSLGHQASTCLTAGRRLAGLAMTAPGRQRRRAAAEPRGRGLGARLDPDDRAGARPDHARGPAAARRTSTARATRSSSGSMMRLKEKAAARGDRRRHRLRRPQARRRARGGRRRGLRALAARRWSRRSATHAHYARIVKDHSILRSVLATSREIQERVMAFRGEPRELIEQAEQELFRIGHEERTERAALDRRRAPRGARQARAPLARGHSTSPAPRPASTTSTTSPAASSPAT